jgi:DNA-binding response OmpR family regulator
LAQLNEQHRRELSSPSGPGVLLVYGEQRANAALAGELELDGYRVHRTSHPGTLRKRCKPGEVDLVIFGHSPHRGLDVLRALRAGNLAPGASGVRVLWIGTSRETTTSLLRAFEAGADDVTRVPLGYAEMLGLQFKYRRRGDFKYGQAKRAITMAAAGGDHPAEARFGPERTRKLPPTAPSLPERPGAPAGGASSGFEEWC